MKGKKYPMLSELTSDQKSHLAWRLDHNTGWGLVSIGRLIKGEWGDKRLDDLFLFAEPGWSRRRARIHATKVMNYTN